MTGHGFATSDPEPATDATDTVGLVVFAREDNELGPWEQVAVSLSRVLGLTLRVERSPAVAEESDPVGPILRRAAELGVPVLVLPPSPPGGETLESALRELGSVLVPFDTSDAEAAVIRPLATRLRRAGVAVAQLHVLTAETRPAMWDGAGHHAESWHAEIRRRHQVESADLEIVVGVAPGSTVIALATRADAVVLCWKRQLSAERSQLVRTVLSSIDVPVLLMGVS